MWPPAREPDSLHGPRATRAGLHEVAPCLAYLCPVISYQRGSGVVDVAQTADRFLVELNNEKIRTSGRIFLADIRPYCATHWMVTVNVTGGPLVPFGLVTVTALPFAVAPPAIVNVVVIWVPVAFTVKAPTVIPFPATFTAVVPVRFAPARVTLTVVPRLPVVGLIELNVGNGRENVTALLFAPFAVTVMLLVFIAALLAIVNVVVIWVPAAFTVKAPCVTPPPAIFIAVVPVRLVPVRVTLIVVPRRPEVGEIDVSVGGPMPVPVSVTGEPMTGTLAEILTLPLNDAAVVGLNTILIVQLEPAASVATQVPPAPPAGRWNGAETVTVIPVAVAPPLFLRVSVRAALVVPTSWRPKARDVGVTLRTAATDREPWNSVAPTSNPPGTAGSGRGFPKKSVAGACLIVANKLPARVQDATLVQYGTTSIAGEVDASA